jgi:DNA-binding beta-propeller fold protein YncE
MKLAHFLSGGAALLIAACAAETSSDTTRTVTSITLVQGWVLDGFDAPESIIFNADKTEMYVSNVNGGGSDRDGNGYISRITPDGTLIEKDWVTGLNGPKGLALANGALYVTDIDELVLINPETGDIITKIPAPDAEFLNDVAYIPDVGILVSDSSTAKILILKDEALHTYVEDARLGGVNGLQAENGKILVTTMRDGELLSLDPATKEMTTLAGGMENADGIGLLGNGAYLTSSWPGEIHHVTADGTASVLLDTQADNIYMNDVYLADGVLYTPNWQPGTVRVFTVTVE